MAAETAFWRDTALNDDSRFRFLVNMITDYAIFMLTPEGKVASWNAGAQRFKGYKPEEIIGSHFSRFYTAADRRSRLPERALSTAIADGRFENEGWRVRKDGSRFWAHVIIDAIHAPDGELLGFAKITRDLTERKQVEEELKHSEEQFRLLVQGVSDYAIYMLDCEGRVSSWNVGAQRIKGYAPEEIIGAHFSSFYTQEDRLAGEPQRGLETAKREGRFEKEGWRVRKDGTRFWANVVIDAIHDDRGKLLGFAKVTRDISEKVKAQQALDQTREDLFLLQKMETIGQLTGGVAHDFNNLLMVISGSLEIARKRLADNPAVLPLIDNAIKGVQRGAALTQRMLAFSRRQKLKVEPIDVLELLHGMEELLERSLGPAHVLRMELPEHMDPISSDSNQLENAILNLVINARDAMPDGGTVTISAGLSATPPPPPNLAATGRYACISVSDTGEGMDAETLSQATIPFFTTKGVGKGTGLGLPMVMGLTEQSGGRLVLKSRKQVGTTVELWFPVTETVRVRASRNKPDVARLPPVDASAFTVLAVDDDSLVLTNTILMLEELGYKVLKADSAADALALLRQNSVDLVISDHAMPHMSGAELADLVRRQWPGLPIILATGYAELSPSDDIALARLAKPFSQAQLAEAVMKAMA